MTYEPSTASDKRRISRVGMTASGLASAAQLIDVTPVMTVTIDQGAAARPLIVLQRNEPPQRYLSADDDPEDMLDAAIEDFEAANRSQENAL